MVDWEVELGVVIGSTAKNVGLDDALNHIAGYCVVNDVSERGWQLQGTGQWVKGKSADSFGPIGPWVVTRDEVSNPQALKLELSVNGQIRQNSSTAQMIFPVKTLFYIVRPTIATTIQGHANPHHIGASFSKSLKVKFIASPVPYAI